MIPCPSCSADIQKNDVNFCPFCGQGIKQCPHCAAVNVDSAAFCCRCGSHIGRLEKLIDEAPTWDEGDQESDHDLRGSTSFIEVEEVVPKELMVDAFNDSVETNLRTELREEVLGFLFTPDQPDQRYPLFLGDNTVGVGDKNDIVVTGNAISWNHAIVIGRGSEILIQDSASTNGTFLNGLRVERPHRLRNGDLVRLGNVDFSVWLRPDLRES